MIDAHTHIFATINGISKAGPTRGLGHGRLSFGGETLVVAPDLGDETTFPPQELVAMMDATGVEQAVLLQGPFFGECNAYAAETVRKYPQLTIVICHLAQPSPALASDRTLLRQWQQQIDLGRLPNVHLDTAALPVYFRDEAYPLASCREFIQRAVDSVGPQKILWGSDVPGTLSILSYPQYVELAAYHTDFLPSPQQKQVLAENARRVYFSS